MAAASRNTPVAARSFSSAAADAAAAAASPLYPAAGTHTLGAFVAVASPAAAGARARGRSGSTPAALSTSPAARGPPRSPAAAPASGSPSARYEGSSSTSSSAAASSTSSAAAAAVASPVAANAPDVGAFASSSSATLSTTAAASSLSLHVAAACLPAEPVSTTTGSTAADAVSALPIGAAASSTTTDAQETRESSSSASSSSTTAAAAAGSPDDAVSSAPAPCAAAVSSAVAASAAACRSSRHTTTATAASAAAAARDRMATRRPAIAEISSFAGASASTSSPPRSTPSPVSRIATQSALATAPSTARHPRSGYPAAASSSPPSRPATSSPRPSVAPSFLVEAAPSASKRTSVMDLCDPLPEGTTASPAAAAALTISRVSPQELYGATVCGTAVAGQARLSSGSSVAIPTCRSRAAATGESFLYRRGDDSTVASSPAQFVAPTASSAADSRRSTETSCSASSSGVSAAAAVCGALPFAVEVPEAEATGVARVNNVQREAPPAAAVEAVRAASVSSEKKAAANNERAPHRLVLPTDHSSLAAAVAVPGIASAPTDLAVARNYQETGQQSPPCSSVAAAAAAALVTAARSTQLLQPAAATRPSCRAVCLTAGTLAAPAEPGTTTQAPMERTAIRASREEVTVGSVEALTGAPTLPSAAAAAFSAPAAGPLAGAATAAPFVTAANRQRHVLASVGTLGRDTGTTDKTRRCSISAKADAYAPEPSLAVTAPAAVSGGRHPVSQRGQGYNGDETGPSFMERYGMGSSDCSSAVAVGTGSASRTLDRKRRSPAVPQPSVAAAVATSQVDGKSCAAGAQQSCPRVYNSSSREAAVAAAATGGETAETPTATLPCPSGHKARGLVQTPAGAEAAESGSRTGKTGANEDFHAAGARERTAAIARGKGTARAPRLLPSAASQSPSREPWTPGPSSRRSDPALQAVCAVEARTAAADRVVHSEAAAAALQPVSARRRATQRVAVTKTANGSISARTADRRSALERIVPPVTVASGDFTCALRRGSSESERAATGKNTGGAAVASAPVPLTAVPQGRRAAAAEEKDARDEFCIDCRLSKEDSPSEEQPEEQPQERGSAAGSAKHLDCRCNIGDDSNRPTLTSSSRRRKAAARLSAAFRTISSTFIQISPRTERSVTSPRGRPAEAAAPAPAVRAAKYQAAVPQEGTPSAETRTAQTSAKPTDEVASLRVAATECTATSRAPSSAEGGMGTAIAPDSLLALSPSFSSSCPSIASEHTSPFRSLASSLLSGGTNSSRASTPPSSAESSPSARPTSTSGATGAAAVTTMSTKAPHTRAIAQPAAVNVSLLVPPPATDASYAPKPSQKLIAGDGTAVVSEDPVPVAEPARRDPLAAAVGSALASARLSDEAGTAVDASPGKMTEGRLPEQTQLQRPSRRQQSPQTGAV